MSEFKHYESVSEQVLPKKLPIVVRIDGQGFSTLTDNRFEKPFDSRFESLMNAATRSVMEYCTQAELAYIQSDEISVLLPQSEDPFLGGRTQKLSSLFAGHASAGFTEKAFKMKGVGDFSAAFDARAFVLPKQKVLDYFIWRQEDAFRNCVFSTAFYELAEETSRDFAQERLHGASMSEQQELLFQRFDINVNDLPTHRKRGRALKRVEEETKIENRVSEEKMEELLRKGYAEKGQIVTRKKIKLDNDIPEFTKNSRYIDHHIYQEYPSVA